MSVCLSDSSLKEWISQDPDLNQGPLDKKISSALPLSYPGENVLQTLCVEVYVCLSVCVCIVYTYIHYTFTEHKNSFNNIFS